MSGTHSLLSPSSAHRWSRCVGSVALTKDMPNPPSKYSAEGTAYHQIGAKCLETGLGAWASHWKQILDVDGFQIEVTEENCDHVEDYIQAIRRLPGVKYIEVQLDLSEILGVPGQGGTADCVALDYEQKNIHVADLKFGRGERVDAKDNEQLLLYAAGALFKYELLNDWQTVTVAIHQPRLDHYDEQTYTVEEVYEFTRRVRQRAQMAYDVAHRANPQAEARDFLTPGDKQCRWCPARATCTARTNHVLQMFPIAGQVPDTHDAVMDDAELVKALNRADEIAQWCSDVRAEALRRALIGRQLAGWKLVDGRRGNRAWINAKQTEAALVCLVGEEIAYAPRVIISPAVAEKALRKMPEQWAALQAGIEQAAGAKVLERETDARPARPASVPEFGLQEPA